MILLIPYTALYRYEHLTMVSRREEEQRSKGKIKRIAVPMSSGGSFFAPDIGYVGGAGDIEVRLLHQLQGQLVQLAASRPDAIS